MLRLCLHTLSKIKTNIMYTLTPTNQGEARMVRVGMITGIWQYAAGIDLLDYKALLSSLSHFILTVLQGDRQLSLLLLCFILLLQLLLCRSGSSETSE